MPKAKQVIFTVVYVNQCQDLDNEPACVDTVCTSFADVEKHVKDLCGDFDYDASCFEKEMKGKELNVQVTDDDGEDVGYYTVQRWMI